MRASRDEYEDMRSEFVGAEIARRQRIGKYACSDRTCGAEDCASCYLDQDE